MAKYRIYIFLRFIFLTSICLNWYKQLEFSTIFINETKVRNNKSLACEFGVFTSGVFLYFFCENDAYTCRSSHWRCSVKKSVLKNFTKFTWKNLCQNLFFNKVAGFRPATLLKRDCGRCFPVNFVKFLGTPFLQNTSGRLLLYSWRSESYKIAHFIFEIICFAVPIWIFMKICIMIFYQSFHVERDK